MHPVKSVPVPKQKFLINGEHTQGYT